MVYLITFSHLFSRDENVTRYTQYYYDYYEERRGFFAAKKGIGLISIVKEGGLEQ